MLYKYLLIVSILQVGALLSVKTRKLTPKAAVAGFTTGLLVFVGAGYTGIAMLAGFFLLGTFATSWGTLQKQRLGLAEKNRGQRTTGQVLANAGVAALLGLCVVAIPEHTDIITRMIAASLASATADTLSSELGVVYGRKFYNILTLKQDIRGLDGVVSIEGTWIGIAGAGCIAAVYATGFGTTAGFFPIIIAGAVGNLTDSILGASLERKNYLNNDAVNFLNTAIAALVVLILHFL